MLSHSNNIPLIIDLDGTLTKSDTLVESAIIFIRKKFFNVFLIIGWLLKGKIYFKNQLIKQVQINPKDIPYNKDVLSFVLNERKKRNKLILCSGAHKDQVKLIFNYFNFFDDYYGSSEDINLVGKNKSNFLVENYGKNNFDYIGNSFIDLDVWKESRNIYLVNVSNRLKRKLFSLEKKTIDISSKKLFFDKVLIFFKTLRVHQWVKNLLVFVPLFFSYPYHHLSPMKSSLLGFISFSLVASLIYIINDTVDLQNDRKISSKKNRTIASGDISILNAFLIGIFLFIISIFLSIFFLNYYFLFIIFIYIFLNLIYSFYLKKIVLIDILILSFFYILRIYSGGVVSGIEVSIWLTLYGFFLFTYLATIKRLTMLTAKKFNSNEGNYGISHHYYPKFLFLLLLISGISSIILFSVYLKSEKVINLYYNPNFLFLIIPIMICWLVRIFIITKNGKMSDDLILFVLKDKITWLCALLTFSILVFQMKIW